MKHLNTSQQWLLHFLDDFISYTRKWRRGETQQQVINQGTRIQKLKKKKKILPFLNYVGK